MFFTLNDPQVNTRPNPLAISGGKSSELISNSIKSLWLLEEAAVGGGVMQLTQSHTQPLLELLQSIIASTYTAILGPTST